jgi:hypothetical protein
MKGWGIPIIADFSGLEFAAMLEILDVSGRVPDPVFGATFPVFETTDLSFLNSLSELRILKLAYNHMDSFEWVSGLENLQELDLRDTGLTHFGLSKELPKLDVLDLRQNPIRSLQLPGRQSFFESGTFFGRHTHGRCERRCWDTNEIFWFRDI